MAVWPESTVCVPEVVLTEKSVFAVKEIGALWVRWELSVPVPVMLKLKAPVLALLAVTLNAAPDAVGVTLEGLAVHVDGGVPVQDRLTGLLYPLIAVRVPEIGTAWLTTVVNEEPFVVRT